MTDAVTYLRNLVGATAHYIEADTATIRLDRLRGVLAELDRLRAENEVLREIERDVSNALPGVYYMDPPDGGSVPLGEQVRRMAVDAARYRWLRGDSCPDHSSRWTQWEVRCWKAPSWTGDLRRADLDDAIDAAIDAARERA